MKRFMPWLIFVLGLILLPSLAWAADIDPEKSSAQFAVQEVQVGQDVQSTIHFADAQSKDVHATAGKVYIWANDAQGKPSKALSLVPESVAQGVFLHDQKTQGVLTGDAKSFGSGTTFTVRFTEPGTYTLQAVYFSADITFDINYANYYWPYMFQGGNQQQKTIRVVAQNNQVVAPPTSDVPAQEAPSVEKPQPSGATIPPSDTIGYAFANSYIDSKHIESLALPAGGRIEGDKAIPLPDDGKTAVDVEVLLYQPSGYPVASGTPVQVSVPSGIEVISHDNSVNALGRTSFSLSGTIADRGYVTLDVDGWSVQVPLASYNMGPKKVMLVTGSKTMEVDGKQVASDTAPMIQNGRTYVPFRAIGEMVGAEVSYDAQNASITTILRKDALTMTIGSKTYAFNGKTKTMDAVPFVMNSRTMVPVRFVAEAFGYQVRSIPAQNGSTAAVILERP